MLEFLSALDGETLAFLVFFVAATTVVLVLGVTGILVFAWLRHRRQEIVAGIVHEMLDQGLPVEQIERVLRAARFGGHTASHSILERLLQHRSRAAQRSAAAAASARDVLAEG